MQMGCELIKKWKALVPARYQMLGIVGRLAYWNLRLGAPWIRRLPKILGIPFPVLENNYFVLATDKS